MRPALVCSALLLVLPLGAATAQTDGAAERARAEGQFVRALTAHYLGNDSTAARLLDGLLDERPDDPAVLDVRAEVALAQGRPADALFFAERAADQAPDRPALHLRLAEARRATGQHSAAADALQTARRLAPTDPDVLSALVGLYAETGQTDAERDALEALVAVSDAPAARVRLAILYEQAGASDRARTAAEAAARLAPNDPAVQRLLTRLDSTNDPAAPSPPPPDATGLSGTDLYDAGRYAEAADALLAMVEEDPRRLDAWALALDALARTSDPRAGAAADDALLLFSAVPSVLAAAAEAYLSAGRAADARRTAQRGLDTLDTLGDDAPDADTLRPRLVHVLDAAGD